MAASLPCINPGRFAWRTVHFRIRPLISPKPLKTRSSATFRGCGLIGARFGNAREQGKDVAECALDASCGREKLALLTKNTF